MVEESGISHCNSWKIDQLNAWISTKGSCDALGCWVSRNEGIANLMLVRFTCNCARGWWSRLCSALVCCFSPTSFSDTHKLIHRLNRLRSSSTLLMQSQSDSVAAMSLQSFPSFDSVPHSRQSLRGFANFIGVWSDQESVLDMSQPTKLDDLFRFELQRKSAVNRCCYTTAITFS